jgi:hypothetical protein
MFSSRRIALLLALSFTAATVSLAQTESSSSNPVEDKVAPSAKSEPLTAGQLTVQARIKARRAQRRAAAIHDAYDHRYDIFTGMGYLRFVPGKHPGTNVDLEKTHEYAWSVGATRYFDQRLGLTVEGRGYYGTAYVGLNALTNSAITNPAISEYSALAGPTYRFYVLPKLSVSGRVLAGMDYGKYTDDTNHSEALALGLGLWPDGYTFAASGSIPVEFNVTPKVGLRVAPEYFISGFGSTMQYSRGFTTGIVYRFGKLK